MHVHLAPSDSVSCSDTHTRSFRRGCMRRVLSTYCIHIYIICHIHILYVSLTRGKRCVLSGHCIQAHAFFCEVCRKASRIRDIFLLANFVVRGRRRRVECVACLDMRMWALRLVSICSFVPEKKKGNCEPFHCLLQWHHAPQAPVCHPTPPPPAARTQLCCCAASHSRGRLRLRY